MNAPKEVQTPGEFKYELCELSALYTYYGQMPPNSHYCDCSLFYSKRFSFPCVKENLKAFPLEIQEGMDKRKPQQKSCKKKWIQSINLEGPRVTVLWLGFLLCLETIMLLLLKT